MGVLRLLISSAFTGVVPEWISFSNSFSNSALYLCADSMNMSVALSWEGHIFQACPVWIYTQSNITQASYSPEYITPTQQFS
jgi:hypothetical protein